jgi:hypothetical protein
MPNGAAAERRTVALFADNASIFDVNHGALTE